MIYNCMKEHIRQILLEGANQVKLSPSKKQRLLKFAENWIALNPKESNRPYFDEDYAKTWANRFKNEREYVDAGGDALYALIQIDGLQKASELMFKQFIKIGWEEEYAKEKVSKYINEVSAKYGTLKGRTTVRVCKKSVKKPSKIIGKLPNFDANFRKLI